jgi:hypothetical protein
VVEFIYVFSHIAVMKKINMSLTKDEISAFLNFLALQAACSKAYKSIPTNSFEIIVNLSM